MKVEGIFSHLDQDRKKKMENVRLLCDFEMMAISARTPRLKLADPENEKISG